MALFFLLSEQMKLKVFLKIKAYTDTQFTLKTFISQDRLLRVLIGHPPS